MRLTHVLAVPAIAVAMLGTTAAPAVAEEAWQAPEVAWVNKNVVTNDGGETARLLVKYRCWGEGVHLWGSAKQGPELDPPANTGSDAAEAWRETPEGPVPTCDGTWHTERVVLQDTPDTANHDALSRGSAWVQFVIFAVGPAGEFGRGAWSGWTTVRGND